MNSLIPRSVFEWPRFPKLWDEDEDLFMTASHPSGLTVSEDEKHVFVEAQVPGVDADKIEVTFDKGVLWIKGQQEQEEKDKKYYRKAASSFSYHVRLPDNVDSAQEPEATCKNGVMKVVFKKTPETVAKKITVKKE